MKKLIIPLLTVLLLSACRDNLLSVEEVSQVSISEHSSSYGISQEEAIENLSAFLNDMEGGSRSCGRIVVSITPVKYSRVSRTSDDTVTDCENLLYVANFENKQGYAILAGDKRIPEPVLAVTDEGSLTAQEVYQAMSSASNPDDRFIFPGYPTTGDGFIRLSNYNNQLFMNPNTVNLYIDSIGDTLVGNFEPNDTVNGFDFDTRVPDPDFGFNPTTNIPTYMCTTYALNSVRNSIKGWDRFQKNDSIDAPIDGVGNNTSSTIEYSNWVIEDTVNPLMTKYVLWHQRSPFNDLSPIRRSLKDFTLGRSPAGCFPLAIAKLIMHYNYLSTANHNGYSINFTTLQDSISGLWGSFPSTEGNRSAAHFLKMISEMCDSWYFKEGTFTFPHEALNFLKFIAWNNASICNYNYDIAYEQLADRKPVIMYGMPNSHITESHAWLLDGYKIKKRTKKVTYYSGNLKSIVTSEEKCKMLHCDFGWSGVNNGYYVDGIFKIMDPTCEIDNLYSTENHYRYNSYLHLITY